MTKEKRTVQKNQVMEGSPFRGLGGGKEESAKRRRKYFRGRRKTKGFTDLWAKYSKEEEVIYKLQFVLV